MQAGEQGLGVTLLVYRVSSSLTWAVEDPVPSACPYAHTRTCTHTPLPSEVTQLEHSDTCTLYALEDCVQPSTGLPSAVVPVVQMGKLRPFVWCFGS